MRNGYVTGVVLWVSSLTAVSAQAGWPGDYGPKCPPDSVKVGATCIDKYEASLWYVPAGTMATSAGKGLVKKIQSGKVTLADLTNGGATQLSVAGGCTPAIPPNFPADGNWTPFALIAPSTPGVYAVSIPGVLPAGCVTWFQAEQACALSNKRLIRNQEWQRAAASTPDPGALDNGSTTCVTNSGAPQNSGSRSACQSVWGVFDLVGNVWEWTGDWSDLSSSTCTDWTTQTGIAGSDYACFGGDGATAAAKVPGAIVRGGSYLNGVSDGVFAIRANFRPSDSFGNIGFRCAR